MRKIFGLVAALATALLSSPALAQGPGGSRVGPSPPQNNYWIMNGGTLQYSAGGLALPAGVTGGGKGVGTINLSGGYYKNNVDITSGAVIPLVVGTTPITGGSSGNVLYKNGSVLGALSATGLNGNVTYVDSGVGACTATGDGVTDDAATIRACMAQVNAAGGGTVAFSCNKTYLLGTKYSDGNGWAILRPYSNMKMQLCASATLKVANNVNTALAGAFIIYPPDGSATYTINNFTLEGGKIDWNGANNTCGGTCYYNNIMFGIARGSNIVVDGTTFANNPGSQNIAINGTSGAGAVTNLTIRNTIHLDSCDIINALCTDHSSIFVLADNYTATNNHCIYSSQSTKSTCWEQWGNGGTFDSNTVKNYVKMANIASIVYGITTRDQVMSNNTGINLGTGYTLWCDGVSSSRLSDITIIGNSFRQSVQVGVIPFFDFDSGITADCATNLRHENNTFRSDVAGGTAGTTPALVLGRAYNQVIRNSSFTNGLGPAIGNGTFSASTSFIIDRNVITDAGQTSTAGGRRGILINSGTTILQATITNNTVLNVASTYMTTCIAVTATVSTNQTSWVSAFQPVNCATPSALTLTNFATITAAGVAYFTNPVGPMSSTNQLNGAALHTDPVSFSPELTRTPTVGVAGSAVGQWCMRNATSGVQCLTPATGALGSSTPTFPAGNYNVVGDTLSQALTGKTYNGLTITTTTGSLTIANGKTLTASNTLTFAGTDGSTLNVGAGGTLGTAAFVNTGTSGATIPLLNGNNTWGGTQVWQDSGTYQVSANKGVDVQTTGGLFRAQVKYNANGGYINLGDSTAAVYTAIGPGIGNTGYMRNCMTMGNGSGGTQVCTEGEMGFAKITASGSAPAAGFCKIAFVAGTAGGTCKMIAYCGTSTTATTVIDNVGGGC